MNEEGNEIQKYRFFLKYFNINFIKSTNFKEFKLFDMSPYYHKVKNDSYKNKIKIDFYQKICRSLIQTSLKNHKPIYALNFLYRSFSNSKVKIPINFDNIDNIIALFNEEILMNRFSNLHRLKKNTHSIVRVFGSIHSKKIHTNINKNLLYFKNKKVKNLQLLNNFQLMTRISNTASLHYLKNCSNQYSFTLTLKMQFLNKKLLFGNCNIFLNNFILLYFNFFSLDYFKNSNFFVNFSELLTLDSLKFMKYNLFNVFIIPIPTILDNIILKMSLDSQFHILLNSRLIQKQKVFNSNSVNLKPNKTLKKKVF